MPSRCSLLFLGLLIARSSFGQLIEKDPSHSANDVIRMLPEFTMHKDVYFITGTTMRESPSSNNSDVKYQIGFKYRLRKSPLPGQIFPFLMYTQKSFWDIYKFSKPFGEINFNPGFALVRPFFLRGHRQAYVTLSMEHESNGRDSIYSRSWNFMALSVKTNLNERWLVGARFWLPFSYKDDNPDLMDYIGYGELNASYVLKPSKWTVDILARKGSGWPFKGSLQTQLSYRPFRNENQFIMLQWFQGYGESLIDYQVHTGMLRIGFLLKPSQLGIF